MVRVIRFCLVLLQFFVVAYGLYAWVSPLAAGSYDLLTWPGVLPLVYMAAAYVILDGAYILLLPRVNGWTMGFDLMFSVYVGGMTGLTFLARNKEGVGWLMALEALLTVAWLAFFVRDHPFWPHEN